MRGRRVARSDPGNREGRVLGGAFASVVSIASLACGSSAGASPPLDGGAFDASLDVPVDARALDGGAHDAAADAPVADSVAPPLTYLNPVLAHDFPDPFVLREGASYFAFATNGLGKNVQAATSSDLSTWSDLPDALPELPAWAARNRGLTWAPSVLRRGASYVMYYTARDVASGFQCISSALASSPGGPYVDTSTAPFVCQVSGSQSFCGSIDPSPFVDSDGTAYLAWKSDENAPACARAPRLWIAALGADGRSLAGPATAILAMDRPWEEPIVEGPSMWLHDGVYFLFYSANAYESAAYAMGYATCLSPVGPCKKVTVDGPLVRSAGSALGPGGQEVFTDVHGRTWLAYHAWTAPSTTYSSGGARSLRIDPLSFVNGAPVLGGPTSTPQVVPPSSALAAP
jgi:beta-xylosidase